MSTSRRAERALFGREAADRERRSRERPTCLAWWVSICISRQKWGVAWLAFGFSGFIRECLTSMAECADSTPTKFIERVCVSPSSKEQICLLWAKVVSTMILGESWRAQGTGKNKTLFQSRVNTGKGDFTTKESLTSAHILKLQRLFNTRIPLPVTLTGSEKVS